MADDIRMRLVSEDEATLLHYYRLLHPVDRGLVQAYVSAAVEVHRRTRPENVIYLGRLPVVARATSR